MRRLAIVLTLVALAPDPAAAQMFFASRPDTGIHIGPLMVRATASPEYGSTAVRILFSVMRPAGMPKVGPLPDLYLLWPGEVTGDPKLGARDVALAEEVTALGFDALAEGRLPLRARRLRGEGEGSAVEPLPGGAPFVTYVQSGGPLGLSPPAAWIKIPAHPRLSDPEWLVELTLESDSLVKPKPGTWLEHWVFGERRMIGISFNEARGRPLFRMYLNHRDRVVRLGDAFAEMSVNFPEANRLKVDLVHPTNANRGLSENLERTEVVSLFLDTGDGAGAQRLTVQYGYFSRTQSTGLVLVPLLILGLGYAIGPLIGRLSVHLAQRAGRHLHVSRWDGEPRERQSGVLLSREVMARIQPGKTTYDDVLRLCGPDGEIVERFPASGRRTLVYRGQNMRPQTRRLIGWLAKVEHREVEHHEVTIEFDGDVVSDIRADVRRSRLPVAAEA